MGTHQDKLVEVIVRTEGHGNARHDESEPARDRRGGDQPAATRASGAGAVGRRRAEASRGGNGAEDSNDAIRHQRQASGLRHHDDGRAHRARRVLLPGARPRPDAEDRLPRSSPSTSTCPARAPRKSRPSSPSRSKRPSTRSAASTSCAPAPDQGSARVNDHVHARARHRGGHAGRPRQGRARSSASSRATRSRRSSRSSTPIRRRFSRICDLRPRTQKELTEIADKQIKQVLETVKDVGAITFQGERKREIQLLLNADRLNAYGLTVDQVRAAVQRQNVEIPGGSFVTGPAEIALRTMGRIKNVDDFNRIVSPTGDGSAITFGDVGRVVDGVQEIRRRGALANGIPRSAFRSASSPAPTPSRSSIACWRGSRRSRRRCRPTSTISPWQRPVALHPPVVRGHQAAPVPRRPPRQPRRVPLHPQPARHLHRGAGGSDVDHRHLHRHEGVRLHAEQHDDARAVAGDGHRHRRRDRRAREHLPVRRGKGRDAEGSRLGGHRRDRPGRHGDDALARRHLRAGRLHDRPDRPLFLQLRHHVGRRDPDLDVRLLHADAGAVRLVAEEGGREIGSLHDQVRRPLREGGSTVWAGECSCGRFITAS